MKYQPTQEELKSIQQRKNLKKVLKSLASDIRHQKKLRKLHHPKHNEYIGQWRVFDLSFKFREMHVAYCLLRGTPLEKIDKNTADLDMKRIEFIQRAAHPDSNEKLYVVVDNQLQPSQMAVQGSHAVAQFLLDNPYTLWRNGTIVFLKSQQKGYVMAPYHGERVFWREPDMKNKITASASFGSTCQDYFKDYNLV